MRNEQNARVPKHAKKSVRMGAPTDVQRRVMPSTQTQVAAPKLVWKLQAPTDAVQMNEQRDTRTLAWPRLHDEMSHGTHSYDINYLP